MAIPKRVVIALGGNALGNTPAEQLELVQLTAMKIAEVAKQGYQIIVGHGNGPQVGMIYNAFADAHNQDAKHPLVPLPEAGGMSQGYIGYHLTTALTNAYIKQKINSEVVYFLTETLIDANDQAFNNPTKPIGPFYKTLAEAQKQNPNSTIVQDAGRGFRKVVASPLPITFLGLQTIKNAINSGATTILGGGGGIPVIMKNKTYVGVDGVIDKDFALAKLAELIDADIFVILTAVKNVCINFNQPNEQKLTNTNVTTLKKYLAQNQFAPGSMKPKVEAVINFLGNHKNKIAYIGDLNDLTDILKEQSGTKITA